MTTPVIVWLCVVGLFALLLVVKAAVAARHNHGMRPHRIVSISSEREEFFAPGDSLAREEDTDDDD